MKKCYRTQIVTNETSESGIPAIKEPLVIVDTVIDIQKTLKEGEDFLRAQDQGWYVIQKEFSDEGDWWLAETDSIYLIKAVDLIGVYEVIDNYHAGNSIKANIKAISKLDGFDVEVL